MVRTRTGLQSDKTGRIERKLQQKLRPPDAFAQKRAAFAIDPMKLEHVLRNIDPDHFDGHGFSPSLTKPIVWRCEKGGVHVIMSVTPAASQTFVC